MTSKEFIHKLFIEYYESKPERKTLEICVRCGSKGVLGVRRPYVGLCRKCRKKQWNG